MKGLQHIERMERIDPFLIDQEEFPLFKALQEGAHGQSNIHNVKGTKRKIVLKYSGKFESSDLKSIMEDISKLKTCVHPAVAHFEGYSPNNDERGYLVAHSYVANTFEMVKSKAQKGKGIKGWNATAAVNAAVGVAAGLRYLHSHGIIHRNLKDSNILIDKNMRPLLTDFYFLHRKGSTNNEYYNTEQPKSASDDMYAYGSFLYELFTMRGLPNPRPRGQSLRTHLQQLGVSGLVSGVIEGCWEESGHKRPSSSDVFNLLAENLTGVHGEAEIGPNRNYLSLLLAFDRERLMSQYGDAMCSQNFGRFLLESSQSVSYRVMGSRFVEWSQKTGGERTLSSSEEPKSRDSENSAGRRKKKHSKRSPGDGKGHSRPGTPRTEGGKDKDKDRDREKESTDTDAGKEKEKDKEEAMAAITTPVAKGKSKRVKGGGKAAKLVRPKEYDGDIWESARRGDVESVRYAVVGEGVDPNESNAGGLTALHVAAQAGQVGVVQLLCGMGKTNVNAKADWGVHFMIIERHFIMQQRAEKSKLLSFCRG